MNEFPRRSVEPNWYQVHPETPQRVSHIRDTPYNLNEGTRLAIGSLVSTGANSVGGPRILVADLIGAGSSISPKYRVNAIFADKNYRMMRTQSAGVMAVADPEKIDSDGSRKVGAGLHFLGVQDCSKTKKGEK